MNRRGRSTDGWVMTPHEIHRSAARFVRRSSISSAALPDRSVRVFLSRNGVRSVCTENLTDTTSGRSSSMSTSKRDALDARGSVVLGLLYESGLVWGAMAILDPVVKGVLGLPSIAGLALVFAFLRKELACSCWSRWPWFSLAQGRRAWARS